MPTTTISLPDSLKAFVDEQIEEGACESASDFIATLVTAAQTAAQKRRAEEKLLRLVREAEASGPATPWTADDLANIQQKGMRRLAEKRGNAKNSKKTPSRRRSA